MLKKTKHGPVYAELFEGCASYTHPGAWHQLPVYHDVRQLPAELAGLRERLLQRFSQEELVAAGVLAPGTEEEPQLSPAVSQPGDMIIALRRSENDTPFDLLTAKGCVSGRRLPACAALRDGRIREMVRQLGLDQICGTPVIQDAALLLALQIPATLSTGLMDLKGPWLDQFCQAYQLERLAAGGKRHQRKYLIDHTEEERPPEALVLLGCRLAEMDRSEPEEICWIRDHFLDLQRHLEILMDRIYLWQPPQHALDKIAFRLSHAGPARVREALVSSFDQHTGSLLPARREEDRLPRHLPEAIVHFQKLLGKPTRDLAEERLAWQHLLKLLHKKLIQPLLQQASSTADPVLRHLSLMAAEISQVVHPRGLEMLLQGCHRLQQGYPGKLPVLPDKEFTQFIKGVACLQKVLQELGKCQQNHQSLWPHGSASPGSP